MNLSLPGIPVSHDRPGAGFLALPPTYLVTLGKLPVHSRSQFPYLYHGGAPRDALTWV